MNKKSRKTKGFAHRLFALLLCCACLAAVVPAYAIASEAGTTSTEAATVVVDSTGGNTTGSETEETTAPTVAEEITEPSEKNVVEVPAESEVDKLYARLMACESLDKLYAILENLTEEEEALLDQFTDEQNAALEAKVQELGGYDAALAAGELDARMYNGSVRVYWDTVTGLKQSASSAGGANVSAVTLGGYLVSWGNADRTPWNGGSPLSTYFSGASANNMKDAAMSITAKTGYYVTGIVVACAPTPGGNTRNPFGCGTWSDGNEFIRKFDLTNSTYADGKYTLSFNINSLYFSHNGRTTPAAYFILITTAKVPTPLYVEYNYGSVENFLTVDANSAFYSPTWTVAASGNNYGSGSMHTSGVLTTDTQFAYQYPDNNTNAVASWSHTANSVSDAALGEAAAKGYYFAGWSVTWYNDCSVTNTQNTYNDNYTMSFKNLYMTGSYNPGDAVQLPTNVRLVAQWKPITLKMTKTVSGLSSIAEHASRSNTYILLLQNLQSDEYVQLQSKEYTIQGDGTLSYTFAATGADVRQAITPGTYKVVETGTYDLTGSTYNAYCTTTYPAEIVEVTADGTVKELKVQNTYSSTPAAYKLTVKKTLSGNMYNENDTFKFTVNYGEGKNETFELGNGGTHEVSIPIGATVTITEEKGSYTCTVTSVTPNTLEYKELESKNGLSFKMPNSDVTVEINNEKSVIVDTGITLDFLPYFLILAAVAAGGVMLTRKRRFFED